MTTYMCVSMSIPIYFLTLSIRTEKKIEYIYQYYLPGNHNNGLVKFEYFKHFDIIFVNLTKCRVSKHIITKIGANNGNLHVVLKRLNVKFILY